MEKSESIKNIAKALQVFHDAMGVIYKTEENPFFKSKYAGLGTVLTAIKEPLQKAGLVFSQFPNGENELTSILMHPESGEWIQGTYKMTPAKNDPQGQGSVITYQRRYALGAILGLNIDEDDDGNSASEAPHSAPAYQSKTEVRKASPFKKATEKQRNFIKKLRDEKGEPSLTERELEDLDAAQASEEIERLMKLSKPEPDRMPEDYMDLDVREEQLNEDPR